MISDPAEHRDVFRNSRGTRWLGALLRRHGYDMRSVRSDEKKVRTLWVPVDEYGNQLRKHHEPSAEEDETEEEHAKEPGQPRCDVCGCVYIARYGVMNRCYRHRDGTYRSIECGPVTEWAAGGSR